MRTQPTYVTAGARASRARRATVAFVATQCVVTGTAATASALTPEPPTPSTGCDWYGSASYKDVGSGVSGTEHHTRDIQYAGSSNDTRAGVACGGTATAAVNKLSQNGNDCIIETANGSAPANYLEHGPVTQPDGALGWHVRFQASTEVAHTIGICGQATTDTTALFFSASCPLPGLTAEQVDALQSVVATCTHLYSSSGVGTFDSGTITQTIRFRRTNCDPTIDSDSDRLADCTEFSLGTDPLKFDTDGDSLGDGDEVLRLGTNPLAVDTDGDTLTDPAELQAGTDPTKADTDGDGLRDDADGCPLDATNTCGTPPPPPDPGNACTGATQHGYTTAHYDADFNTVVAPDPDFFDWDVSGRWCVVSNQVKFLNADSFGNVKVNSALATAAELVGVTFRHDPNDPHNVLTTVNGPIGEVTASTDFDICADVWTLLLSAAGRPVAKATEVASAQVLGRVPTNGTSVDALLNAIALRADASTLQLEEGLLKATDIAMQNDKVSRVIPDKKEAELKAALKEALAERSLALRGTAENSLSDMANRATLRFLDVYDDGGRIVIPRKDEAAARKLWTSIVADLGLSIGSAVADGDPTGGVCMTLWRPILTIHIPPGPGPSFVDPSKIDASVLDIKGGITADNRSN
jgi:hypothetical protein